MLSSLSRSLNCTINCQFWCSVPFPRQSHTHTPIYQFIFLLNSWLLDMAKQRVYDLRRHQKYIHHSDGGDEASVARRYTHRWRHQTSMCRYFLCPNVFLTFRPWPGRHVESGKVTKVFWSYSSLQSFSPISRYEVASVASCLPLSRRRAKSHDWINGVANFSNGRAFRMPTCSFINTFILPTQVSNLGEQKL